jgi:hypothetical protein
MAQDNLDDFAMCYQKAIERLTRVSLHVSSTDLQSETDTQFDCSSWSQLIFDREFPSDYIYYKVNIEQRNSAPGGLAKPFW